VIKNNTTHNHSKDECSGYIIAKPPNKPPIKIRGKEIYTQMKADNITKIKKRTDIDTPNKTEKAAD
jgi:hypothetical protein